MSNKITGVSGPVVGSPERPVAARGNGSGRPASLGAADGSVQLTATAQELQTASAALAGTATTDAQRVAEVKGAIERGEYRPDPVKIAAGLLKLEQQI